MDKKENTNKESSENKNSKKTKNQNSSEKVELPKPVENKYTDNSKSIKFIEGE